MSNAQPSSALREGGVAILGIGNMGAAYATRLSSLGVPLTLFNRTRDKAARLALVKERVMIADSAEACVRARSTVLVACSPRLDAIRALLEPAIETGAVQGKDVVFIVDAGLGAARYMDEVVFERAGAASVANVAMFGTSFNVLQGEGAVMNASGRARSPDAFKRAAQPLLELFGQVTFREGGPRVASVFSMAQHLAFMPIVYSFMHYAPMMAKAGVDSAVALQFFQDVARTIACEYTPLLQTTFAKRDYALFFASHGLAREILGEASATCRAFGIDSRLAELMAEYHLRAMSDPAIADKCFTTAYEVIDPRR